MSLLSSSYQYVLIDASLYQVTCCGSNNMCLLLCSAHVDFPRERVPVVLAPLLYEEQQDITEDRLIYFTMSLHDGMV